MLRWLPVIALAGACGASKTESPPQGTTSHDVAEEPGDPPPLPVDPSLPAGPPKPPDPTRPRPPVTIAGQCLTQSERMVVRLVGDDLRACVDSDGDDTIDRCARWQHASAAWRGFEDAEALDETAPHLPIAFGDNADDRVEQVDNQLEVCPPDRVCTKLMPKLPDEDGEITGFDADRTYRTLAIAMRAGLTTSGHVELWDLVAGRVRTRVKLRRLVEDVEYSFDVRYAGPTLIAIAVRTDNDLGQGVIAGPDGAVRGELANGSRYLATDSFHELSPGTLGVLDLEAPGVPYAVYTHSLATGRVLKKFVVEMDMDGDDDDTRMYQVTPTLLAVVQWSAELRLDLIDVASGRQRTYRVQAC